MPKQLLRDAVGVRNAVAQELDTGPGPVPTNAVDRAFDGVQRSTRYPGGVALRFARVKQYRDDKSADEADTIDMVRSFL